MPPLSSELRRLDADIRTVVRRLAAQGAGPEIVQQEVVALIDARGNGLTSTFRTALLLAAQRQHAWVRGHTLDPAARAATLGIFGGAGSEVARIVGTVRRDVLAVIVQGIQRGVPTAKIEAAIARVVRTSNVRAATLATTAMAAFDQAAIYREAESAEVERFRMVGPPPQRDFCKAHYRRIYTRQEIREMDNGTKFAPEYYVGGPNCRHSWEPVVE